MIGQRSQETQPSPSLPLFYYLGGLAQLILNDAVVSFDCIKIYLLKLLHKTKD